MEHLGLVNLRIQPGEEHATVLAHKLKPGGLSSTGCGLAQAGGASIFSFALALTPAAGVNPLPFQLLQLNPPVVQCFADDHAHEIGKVLREVFEADNIFNAPDPTAGDHVASDRPTYRGNGAVIRPGQHAVR